MLPGHICHRKTKSLLLLAALAAAGAAHSQRVEQPADAGEPEPSKPPVKIETVAADAAKPKTDPTGEEIVEMSVFTVTGSDDEGYQAISTASGSRLKTALKDTAASISAFTAEFLADVGATTLEDMLSYAGNVEFGNDADFDINNNGMLSADGGSEFRVRGMSGGISSNFTESSAPVDLFNVERGEVASGANSILFGMGAQGGTITLSSKRANLQRNKLSATNVVGTWAGVGKAWSYERATLDYNVVLMPRKMALRLLGVYQNAGNWKYWTYNDTKRINPVVSIKPFKGMTAHFSLELGRVQTSTTRAGNAVDQITGWIAAGRPIMPGFGTANAVPGTNQITSPSYYVYTDNDGTVFNYRNAYQSRTSYAAATTNRLSEIESSVDYSTIGPGGSRDQKIENWSAVIEQRVGKFNFELGYFHSKTKAHALSPNDSNTSLRADPNSLVSPPSFAAAAGTVENPHQGLLYMESVWQKNDLVNINNTLRLTGERTLNLKKFGRHRIVGLVEYSETDKNNIMRDEILADQNQVAVTTPGAPNNNENEVVRRHYLVEGDFRTYYSGDGREPITNLVIGDRTFHSAYAMRKADNSHTDKSSMAYMFALQNYWFRNRLVTTFGARMDDITFKRELIARVTDPNDPRILDRRKVLNEWDFTGLYETFTYSPSTFSAGGVWHLSSRFSPFVNYSTNRGTPYLDQRTVLPDGGVPPPTEGRTMDCGIMIDVLGNNKITLRLTRYDSRQFRDARITPNGTNAIQSEVLGSNNLGRIYDALHANGLVTQAEFDARPVYNAGMVDVDTKGYEAELGANVTKNLTFRFLYSYSDRNRHGIFQEIFDYYNANIPVWMDKAQGNDALINTIRQELYASGGVRSGINDQLMKQSGAFGSRPHKVTFTGRYRFAKGALKGFAIGGGMRYQSPMLIPDPHRVAESFEMPPADCRDLALDPNYYMGSTAIKGESLCFFDAFLTYKRKVLNGKADMRLQLNARNIFNNDHVTVGRYSVNDTYKNLIVSDPRQIRFTCEFSF